MCKIVNMKIKRLIHDLINDPTISDKMILLAGPRQVGKTTVAKDWLASTHHEKLYFNWDDEKIRREFRNNANFFESVAREYGKHAKIVFDEIHKLSSWKNVLKGYYDTLGNDFRFFVTGSARIELFHRAGDSMLGRYHLLHMAPLIPNELTERWTKPNHKLSITEDALSIKPLEQESIEILYKFSGFPEPFIKQSERSLNLWHQEYKQRLIKEDLRDLTKIGDINRVEHLVELLPAKIGSPFSLNSIRGDISCSHDTVRSLINALNKLYLITLVRPYNKNIKHSISKEPKLYFMDWTQVPGDGERFENFIAIQLKTFCEYVTDGGWCKMSLFYVRDKQKHETDFLITVDQEPVLLVEAKLSDNNLDSNLTFFHERIKGTTAIQVVMKPGVFERKGKKIWILSANRFFNLLWNT